MRRAIYKPGEFVESDPRIAVTHRRSASNGEIVRQLRRWRIGARTLQDVSAEQYIVDTQIQYICAMAISRLYLCLRDHNTNS